MEERGLKKNILITGVAGFIGYSLAKYLSENTNYTIVGIDNINDYYDTNLKKDRLSDLGTRIIFHQRDLNDNLGDIFSNQSFDCVVNLAAQAGVRYAKKNPDAYIRSNIDGFYNILRTAQQHGVKKILYASSSSVYGANTSLPFKESDRVATPMSLYAATKLANENLASSFFYSFDIRMIGMRFFNVYGPFGRPDMAYFKWTNALMAGAQIELNNNGEMWRDMTYIYDCVRSIHNLIDNDEPESTPEVYNIGNRDPVKIADLLGFIADELDVVPNIKSTQAGDEEPIKTWSDTNLLEDKIGYIPDTDFRAGIKEFLGWYHEYYNSNAAPRG